MRRFDHLPRSIGASLLLMYLCSIAFLQAQNKEANYLVVKYGDESATQDLAGDFLETLGSFLESKLEDVEMRGWIANTPEQASALFHDKRPILAFVPPGFYFAHLSEKKVAAEILVQVPRLGTSLEKYSIVTSKSENLTEKDLRGKIVRTTFAFDSDYLKRVVFPSDFQPGVDFQLEPSQNLADEIFLLLEGGNKAPSRATGILLDTELRIFFEQDDLAWPELEIVWQSVQLPRDLVVAVGSDWQPSEIEPLRQSFLDMGSDFLGIELLDLMSCSGMELLNQALFEAAWEKFSLSQ